MMFNRPWELKKNLIMLLQLGQSKLYKILLSSLLPLALLFSYSVRLHIKMALYYTHYCNLDQNVCKIRLSSM